jgi:hypothetical protein
MAAFPAYTQVSIDVMPLSSFQALYAQIPRIRRQRVAEVAWGAAIGFRDKPQKAISELERD